MCQVSFIQYITYKRNIIHFYLYIYMLKNIYLSIWIFSLNLKPKDFQKIYIGNFLIIGFEVGYLHISKLGAISRSPECESVCILEPYRKFPVELIISFFHFSFFLSVLPGKSGIIQWNVFASSQWFFFKL